MKTVCVLLGGWAFLGDHISLKQFLGMLTAVAGMVLYGFATCACASALTAPCQLRCCSQTCALASASSPPFYIAQHLHVRLSGCVPDVLIWRPA